MAEGRLRTVGDLGFEQRAESNLGKHWERLESVPSVTRSRRTCIARRETSVRPHVIWASLA